MIHRWFITHKHNYTWKGNLQSSHSSGAAEASFEAKGSTKRAEPGKRLRAHAHVLQLLIIGPATVGSAGPVLLPLKLYTKLASIHGKKGILAIYTSFKSSSVAIWRTSFSAVQTQNIVHERLPGTL